MAEWLRPVFGRARTPMPSTSSSDRLVNFSFDESTESEDGNISRPRPASRVSSYVGLRPSTPPTHEPDTFPNFRKPDNVYHQPSGDQMAEMLKVAMMSQSSFAPLPIEYNSCILHVLEAYQAMRVEVGKKEEEIEMMKHKHTEAIQDFEGMATQWEAKEKAYQVELKKLEVLLSQTEGGMEKVTLARSKSTVHGSRKIKEAVRELRPIKQRDSELMRHGTPASDAYSSTTSAERPLYIGEDGLPTSRHRKRNRKLVAHTPPSQHAANDQLEVATQNQILDPKSSKTSFQTALERFTKPTLLRQSPHSTQARSEGLDSVCRFGDLGGVLESESDSSDSSDVSDGLEFRKSDPAYAFEKDLQTPPLPELTRRNPLRKSKRGVSDPTNSPSTTLKSSNTIPNQMGFSFKPGDDLNIVGQRSSLHLSKRVIKEDTRTGNARGFEKKPQPTIDTESVKKPQRPKSAIPKLKADPAKRSASPGPPVEDDLSLRRYDSTSSVLTAIRASSGRNSSNGSLNNGGHKRQGAEKSGSTDAVTAAAQAVVRSRVWSDEPKNSSEPATGNQRKGGRRNRASLEPNQDSGRDSLGSGGGSSGGDRSGPRVVQRPKV